jgi:hypothetical protein
LSIVILEEINQLFGANKRLIKWLIWRLGSECCYILLAVDFIRVFMMPLKLMRCFKNFYSLKREILTVWKGKFDNLEKENFDSLKRKILTVLKREILTVWKGNFDSLEKENFDSLIIEKTWITIPISSKIRYLK